MSKTLDVDVLLSVSATSALRACAINGKKIAKRGRKASAQLGFGKMKPMMMAMEKMRLWRNGGDCCGYCATVPHSDYGNICTDNRYRSPTGGVRFGSDRLGGDWIGFLTVSA